jgi:hypothetical protein
MADKTAAEIAEEERQQAEARGDNFEGEGAGEEGGEEGGEGAGHTADELAAIAAEGDEPKAVPYARFREVNQTAQNEKELRIRAEAERDALKGMAPKKEEEKPVDLKALRRASKEAMLEGDAEKSATIDEQIFAEERRIIEESTTTKAVQTARADQSTRDLRKAATDVAKEHAFLDSNSPEANKEAIAEVVEWRDFYVAKGETPADALLKAVKKVVPLYTKDEGGSGTEDEVARKRQALALSKAGSAATRQPATPTGGKGNRATGSSPITDVAKLSEKEFDALPADEKRRLRGDAV